MSAVAIERPNGKLYRPRVEPRAVLLGYEDDDPDTVIVMHTHDVEASRAVAQKAADEYVESYYGADEYMATISEPEQTWYRRTFHGYIDGDVAYRYLVDSDRGSATIRWELTIEEKP